MITSLHISFKRLFRSFLISISGSKEDGRLSLKNNPGHRGVLSAKLLYSIEHVKNSRGIECSSNVHSISSVRQWVEHREPWLGYSLMACFQTCDFTWDINPSVHYSIGTKYFRMISSFQQIYIAYWFSTTFTIPFHS